MKIKIAALSLFSALALGGFFVAANPAAFVAHSAADSTTVQAAPADIIWPAQAG